MRIRWGMKMAGEMAGKKKKTRLLKRRELRCILEKLCSADMAFYQLLWRNTYRRGRQCSYRYTKIEASCGVHGAKAGGYHICFPSFVGFLQLTGEPYFRERAICTFCDCVAQLRRHYCVWRRHWIESKTGTSDRRTELQCLQFVTLYVYTWPTWI